MPVANGLIVEASVVVVIHFPGVPIEGADRGHHVVQEPQAVFELGELWMGIRVIERAEELFFRILVADRAITTDADAERARAATLPLRLPDRVQQAFAHAVQIAARFA